MPRYRTLSGSEYSELLRSKEDLYFDRKSIKIQPKDLQKTIVAFANSEGGRICVGVDDGGNAENKGMEDYDDILSNGVFAVDPPILDLKTEFLEYSGTFILDILIPKSERVHATSKSEVYSRVGACNRKLTQNEIQILKYKKGEIKFEDECKNIESIAITSSNYFKDYLLRHKINTDPVTYLVSNGFVFNNKPKISSIICFHDKPQNIVKCGIKINRFEMSKTSRKYAYERSRKIFDKNISGPAEKLVEESLKGIFEILSQMKINYPKEAIIEGVVNAVIHRDYSVQEDVLINIYDNLIEIISPGGFPGDIKDIDLNLRRIKRCLRNPTICNVIFSISALENDFTKRMSQDQGEGIRTIFNVMKKAGLSDPKFSEVDNKVHLFLKHENAYSYEQKILTYLDDHDSIANKEARALLGEEDKEKIKNVFSKLEKNGRIERVDLTAIKSKIRYKRVGKKISNKNEQLSWL